MTGHSHPRRSGFSEMENQGWFDAVNRARTFKNALQDLAGRGSNEVMEASGGGHRGIPGQIYRALSGQEISGEDESGSFQLNPLTGELNLNARSGFGASLNPAAKTIGFRKNGISVEGSFGGDPSVQVRVKAGRPFRPEGFDAGEISPDPAAAVDAALGVQRHEGGESEGRRAARMYMEDYQSKNPDWWRP